MLTLTTPNEYTKYLLDQAEEFKRTAADSTVSAETAFFEFVDAETDRNWTEDDAIDVLKFSNNPSAEEFQHGGYKPKNTNTPFPFKTFAAAAFAEDLRATLNEQDFDWGSQDEEDEDEAAGIDPEADAQIARMDRAEIVAALEAAGIQCYDSESLDTLRQALRVNVADGTIELTAE